MLDWIQANREWVFSGIGTAIFVGLWSWFRSNPSDDSIADRSQSVSNNDSRQNIEGSSTLVECNWCRGHVNAVGAPTQNELLILMLFRYPKWSSKSYLRRSLRCITQPLDDSISELVEGDYIMSFFGIFFKLSLSGIKKAKKKASQYEKAYGSL